MSAKSNPRVGLFVTCLVDAIRPGIGFAAIQLLEEAGCRVEVPQAQTCCGQPALNSGDDKDAADLARRTIAAFEGHDYVVLPSGSCAGTMVHAYPELLAVFPEHPLLERSSMNSWDDQNVRDALARNAAQGRKKIVVSGLWTEVCNTTFALSALHDTDYEIYMGADASGGTSLDAHNYAMDRMVQAGVVPVTWQQVLLEWQRDWARRETYDAVMDIVREHSGAYGMGVDYAYTMVHKAAERVQHGETVGPNPAKV